MSDFNTVFSNEYVNLKKNLACLNPPQNIEDVLKQHIEEVKPYIKSLVEYFKKKDVVYFEIGLCRGGSFVLTSNVLSSMGFNVYALGLDLPNTPLWGGSGANVVDDVAKLKPKFLYDIVLGNSHRIAIRDKVANILGSKKVDILFIDGDHSFQGCLHDFELYSPFVEKNGIIVFHDITHFNKWRHVEVWKVWERIKPYFTYREFACKENYGIGTIIWNGVYPDINELR